MLQFQKHIYVDYLQGGEIRAHGDMSIWLGLEGDDSVLYAQGAAMPIKTEKQACPHNGEQASTAGTFHDNISSWHKAIPRWFLKDF